VQQWGTLWLNLAGRLILLKSAITSLPLYRFSLYQAPAIFTTNWKFLFAISFGKGERMKNASLV